MQAYCRVFLFQVLGEGGGPGGGGAGWEEDEEVVRRVVAATHGEVFNKVSPGCPKKATEDK